MIDVGKVLIQFALSEEMQDNSEGLIEVSFTWNAYDKGMPVYLSD